MAIMLLAILGVLSLPQEAETGNPFEVETLPTSLAADQWPLEEALRLEAPLPLQDPPDGQDPRRTELPRAADGPASAHTFCLGYYESHISWENWRDYVWRDYLTEPPVLVPLACFAAALVASRYDQRLETRFSNILGHRSSIGNITMWSLGAVALGSSLLGTSPGRSGEDQFWSAAESFVSMTAVVWVLKSAVDRHRPIASGPDGTFPSGHTAAAFWAASVIHSSLGDEWGIPAYAVAALTGLSRLDVHQHWTSDVLAGAGIGILVAGMFDALHFGTGRTGAGICGTRLEFRTGDAGERSFMGGLSFGF